MLGRMNLHAIIDEVADEADDFLAGASNRSEARAGISERLTIGYPQLAPADRAKITDAVMAILEEEDFFVGGPVLSTDLLPDGSEAEDDERTA